MDQIQILLTEKKQNKKTTINPKNNDEKCFQYAVKVALNHKNNKNNPEIIKICA